MKRKQLFVSLILSSNVFLSFVFESCDCVFTIVLCGWHRRFRHIFLNLHWNAVSFHCFAHLDTQTAASHVYNPIVHLGSSGFTANSIQNNSVPTAASQRYTHCLPPTCLPLLSGNVCSSGAGSTPTWCCRQTHTEDTS